MVKTFTLIAKIQTSSTGKQFIPCACKQNIDINIETLNFNELLLHLATQLTRSFGNSVSDLAKRGCRSTTRRPSKINESTWHREEN